MQLRWFLKRRILGRPRRRIDRPQRAHYEAHKELARSVILERLAYWNALYGHTYKRVAIRNQVSRWGSCSTKLNLNFNYRLIFLPQELMDYVIVHELCHLKHFNHGADFWLLIEEKMPKYREHKAELQSIAASMYHPSTKIETLHTLS